MSRASSTPTALRQPADPGGILLSSDSDGDEIILTCVTGMAPGGGATQISCEDVEAVVVEGDGGDDKVKVRKRLAVDLSAFEVSSEKGSTFKCKIDKGSFKACKSPFHLPTRNLTLGRHTIAVVAVNPAGTPDSTPATLKFSVAAKPRPHKRSQP